MKKILILIIPLFLLSFTIGDTKSEYILPLRAYSSCFADIDLDGDMDVIVGHHFVASTEWGGLSILTNDGTGYFQLTDSLYFDYGFPYVHIGNIDNNEYPDIYSIHITTDPYTVYIGIIYNYGETQFDSIHSFYISDYMADRLTSGDINGDGFTDIIFAFNVEQQWGVIYNDGTGNFSEPEYYNTDMSPNNIAVGDIDGNGRDDIAIAGSDSEIWYSFESGFETFYFTGAEHSIAIKDMDKDGDMDVITTWGAGVTDYIVYENLGYQNFQQHYIYTFNGASGGLHTPNIDLDLLPEITFLDGINFYIMYNEGNLIFSEPVLIDPGSFTGSHNYQWSDLDNNDYQDIILLRNTNNNISNLKILFNDGEGNYGENPIVGIENKISSSNNQSLINSYPNPFTTKTTIEIKIKENKNAEVLIYDLSGKEVKTLTYKTQKGGKATSKWDGLNKVGKVCKPGLYFLAIKVNGKFLQTRKIIKY